MWRDPDAMTDDEIKAELATLTGDGWQVEARRWRLTWELEYRNGGSDDARAKERRL
jgi:hypothetical protein